MDKRFFLALLLTGVVVVVTPMLFQQPVPPPSAVPPAVEQAAAPAPSVAPAATPSAAAIAAAPAAQAPTVPVIAAETLSLANELVDYRISTRGAAFVSAELPRFRKLGNGEGEVRLAHARDAMVRYRIVAGGDTLALDQVTFTAVRDTVDGRPRLTLTGILGAAPVTVTYHLAADNYLADVTLRAAGLPQPAFLLTDLPSGFDSQEADTTEDHRHLAYAMKPEKGGARRVDFRKPDPGERILEPGPLTWAVAKSKYFLVGVLAPESAPTPFAEVQVLGAPRENKVAVRASATVISPFPESGVRFELFAGPQEWQRLVGMGREFQNSNPYGGFASGVVQPFATIVMRILLWMKRILGIEYGWILVIFGIAIRLLMWPLNAKMMRSSIQMQRIAPEVQAAQKAAAVKFPTDRAKQQEMVMKVYADHGVSPFAALGGCLPMLLTMPVLFALFFVFQNTIEFRGVSFLWLSDISLKDPYYILPLLMGVSMFVLSWVGMRNVPPNPQTKMMSYLMPVIMTVALLNFASGLNLYYAVQNLAALPQQWLIANERAKAKPTDKSEKPAAVVAGGSERKKR